MDVGFCYVCSKPFGGCGFGKSCVMKIESIAYNYTRFLFFEFVNVIDPSAGSPTETLLRLLLPRNVQI